MADNIKPGEVSEILLSQLRDMDDSLHFEEIGKALQVSDGVVRIYGHEPGGRQRRCRSHGTH